MEASAKLPRLVSVIVPTRNRPQLLRKALESIRAIEGADIRFEILVGDNGGLPETQAIVREFDAIHLTTSVSGAGAARNLGLAAATGDYIAFLDDDDCWLEGHIRQQIALLEASPDIDGVVGQTISIDVDGNPLGPPMPDIHPGTDDDLLRRMLGGYFPQIGTFVGRRIICNTIGAFDEALLGGQDLDWLLRIARRRRLAFLSQPCVLFRERPPGSYDQLNYERIKFDRRVFLRHALPEMKIWRSPVEFARNYTRSLRHFYSYFRHAAVMRSRDGDVEGVRFAIRGAFRVFPVRFTKEALFSPEVRHAVLLGIGLVRKQSIS